MTIKGVLFDLDDTLYDRPLAFRAWAERFITTQVGPQESDALAETIDLLVKLDDNGYGSKEALFGAFKERFPGLSHEVDHLTDLFRQDFPAGLVLDPGAEALLGHLRQKKIPFGIITNGLRYQRPKLAALGVDQWTSCIFVSSEFGCKKPDPRIFLAASAELNLDASEILFVGDHPSLDIAGAHGVGMRTAWVNRAGTDWPSALAPVRPDFTISSLDELIPLFGPTSG
jgi:putative hydrolase of the HAD superfamily